MKINKVLYKIILLTIILSIFNFYVCYAAYDKDGGGAGDYDGGGTLPVPSGGSPVGLPDLSIFTPPVAQGGTIIDVTNKILGAIIAIGVILITVFIALTGFGIILGSAEEKAVAKEKFGGYIIAVVVLTCGAAIAKLIISVAETFG